MGQLGHCIILIPQFFNDDFVLMSFLVQRGAMRYDIESNMSYVDTRSIGDSRDTYESDTVATASSRHN
jgi:hypothetical protein